MPLTVDYYYAAQSPWAYLGHERLRAMCRNHGARIALRPVDLGEIFPQSGGLPLAKRAPQRQSYRLIELRRFSEHTGVPLNIQPRHFPVPGNPASLLMIAVDQARGIEIAMDFTLAVFRALWVQERDIASDDTLAALLAECGLPADLLAASRADAPKAAYAAYTAEAMAAEVYGSPTYVIQGERFWGQDRLDFVERRLAKG
ncbi:MAG: 2-hydroxychromene-2-carboxylate isomerase [Aquabacterium sp.]